MRRCPWYWAWHAPASTRVRGAGKTCPLRLRAVDFYVGQRVRKVKGYPFDATVVAVFANLAGETRLVCESTLIPGMLHIFSPAQMEAEA